MSGPGPHIPVTAAQAPTMASFKAILFEPLHEISNNVVYAASKGSDQPAHTRRLIRAFACRLNII